MSVKPAVSHPNTPKIERPPARTIPSENPEPSGTKRILLTQMIKAKRAGTWFGLDRVKRGLYSLAMRLDVKLESHELLKALVSVLKCLKETCDRAGMAFMRAMRLAWAISEAAVRWGNAGAKEWRNDQNFVKFLAISLEAR